MFDLFSGIPQIFWIFAGIALIMLASGYCRTMRRAPHDSVPAGEWDEIKQRLERIERHLDLRDNR